jgi:hypothetical protein
LYRNVKKKNQKTREHDMRTTKGTRNSSWAINSRQIDIVAEAKNGKTWYRVAHRNNTTPCHLSSHANIRDGSTTLTANPARRKDNNLC